MNEPEVTPRGAMVLAAGLGKRMRPLTDDRPKPLVEVDGRTLIDRVLDRFRDAGIERVVVNLHYFRDMLEAHLRARRDLRLDLSPEEDLLETGGGVRQALPRLGDAPFYVSNADVLWLDGQVPALHRLAQAWRAADMDALLLLQPTAAAIGYEGGGDFFRDTAGRLRRRPSDTAAPYIFAGVQILHPRLFAGAPAGAFSLNVLFDRAQTAGRLFGLVHDGLWFHVGSPQGLAETEAILRDGRARLKR